MKAYDAVIIGGGHNGLVCAAYLAKAGKRVVVLERRERVGGAAWSEEVFPGFRFSVFSYVVSLLRPEIIRELELPRHGLHILPLESTLTPLHEDGKAGDYVAQWNDQLIDFFLRRHHIAEQGKRRLHLTRALNSAS